MKYLLIPVCLSAWSACANVTLFHQSAGYTDIAPLQSMLSDDWSEYPEKDASEGVVEQQYGIRWQLDDHWQLQLAKRLTGSVETDAQTARAYYQIANKQALTLGEVVPVKLDFRSMQARGLSVAYADVYEKWQYQLRLSHWAVSRFRQTSADGQLVGGKNGAINGLLNFEEVYSHRNFLKRPYAPDEWEQDGQGFSADLSIRGQLAPQLSLELVLQDVYSSIEFDNLGYAEGTINSQNSFINNAGYLEFIPVLQGRELAQSYKTNLPKNFKATAGWQWQPDQQILLQAFRLGTLKRWQLGFAQRSGQAEWRFWFDPQHALPGVQYQRNDWLVEMAVDKFAGDDIKQLRLNFSIPLWF